jgi:hypothetical protein
VSYATKAEFKAWIGVDDVEDDESIQSALDAATRSIDRMTNRHFTRETGVTKTYQATCANELAVSDLISVSSITVDINGNHTYSRTLSTDNYDLYPYVDETGMLSTRYSSIRIRPISSLGFAPGYLVRVVGDFGYVDADNHTPADIKQACLILASRLWKRRETPFGVLSMPDIGTGVQLRRTDPDVANLLDPYTLSNSWVAV